jgi:hypothetical protein
MIRPKPLFRTRRPASAALESMASVRFRHALYEEQAAEFRRQRAVAELERIAADALDKSPSGIEASVFVVQSLMADDPADCLMCGAEKLSHIATWHPSAECLRDQFGMTGGRIALVLYPLCLACARACHQSDRPLATIVEDRILAALAEQRLIPQEATP